MQRDPHHSENLSSSYEGVNGEETNALRSERGIVGKVSRLVKEAERWKLGTNKEVKNITGE
jgi:hypothetical protein